MSGPIWRVDFSMDSRSVIAFRGGRETEDMIQAAEKAGVPVWR